MQKALLLKLKEALTSVLPVGLIVLILSLTPLVTLSGREMTVFCISAALLIAGIALFNLGADLSMTPMGHFIGEGLTKSKKASILLLVSFFMGLLITVAEPDLAVLADQVSSLMNGMLLIATVGLGVGIFLLVAVLKIVTRADLKAFCQRYFTQNGLSDALVDVITVVERRDGGATQHVTVQLKNSFVQNREDVPLLIDRLKKLIEARSVNILPLMVDYLAVVS